MKTCLNGHSVPDDAKFCTVCGIPVEDTQPEVTEFVKTCPNGHEVQDEAKFCLECGAAIVQSAPSEQPAAASSQYAQPQQAEPSQQPAGVPSQYVQPQQAQAQNYPGYQQYPPGQQYPANQGYQQYQYQQHPQPAVAQKGISPIFPSVVMMIASVMLIVSAFLPYIVSPGWLGEYSYSFSLFSALKEAVEVGLSYLGNGIFLFIAVVLLMLLSMITLIFSLFRRSKIVLIFSILTLLPAIFADIYSRSEMGVPNFGLKWGISYFLFYILPVVIIIFSIWSISAKKRI